MINWTPPGSGSGGPTYNPHLFNPVSSGDCCPPVEILDSHGNIVATIVAGGSYTLNPQTFTRIITIKAGWTTPISFESIAAGTIDVLASGTTNVASAIYTRRPSGTVITPPYHVNRDEIINIAITPTNPAIDSVLTLQGIFDTVSVSVGTQVMGGTGRFGYQLNEVSKSVTKFDTQTDLPVTTVALDAGSLHTVPVYCPVDNKIYIWGFSGVNTLTMQVYNCANDTVAAMTSNAFTNIGSIAVYACYNYIRDLFYVFGGFGWSIIQYNRATATFSDSVNSPGIPTGAITGVRYFGYADHFEDSIGIFTSGTMVVIKQTSTTTYRTIFQQPTAGNFDGIFNTINRQLYLMLGAGGPIWYAPPDNNYKGLLAIGAMRGGGVAFNPVTNKILGCRAGGRDYGVFDVTNVTSNSFAPAAVGAETGFRTAEYGVFANKFYMSTASGNLVRAISPTTDAIIADITVANQKVGVAGNFNQMCFDRLRL